MAETTKPVTHNPPAVLPQNAQAQKNVGRPKRTPDEQAEYFYNQKSMHRLMFFSSFFLLFALVLMLVDDYWGVTPGKNRDWKDYQAVFSSMELTRLQFEIAKLNEAVAQDNEKIAKIDREIEREKERLADPATEMEVAIPDVNPATLEKGTKKVKVKPVELDQERLALLGDFQLKQQQMNFDKSEYMTLRWQYEEALHHLDKAKKEGDTRLKVHEKHYQDELEKWNEIQKRTRESKAAFDEVDRKMSAIEDKILAAKSTLTKLTADKAKFLKERDERILRLNREKPQLANKIRNAPMLDFFDATIKVQQQVVPTFLEDFNFAKVEKVDRCHTCHKGIDNPGYAVDHFPDRDQEEDRYVFRDEYLRKFVRHASNKTPAAECEVCASESKSGMIVTTKHGAWQSQEVIKYTKSLMAHPKLEMFAGPGSSHPIDKFGCTSCHEGDGRDTEFSRVVHMPDTEAQRKDWERRHHYHYRHLWDAPMLPKRHFYASCRKCHSGEVEVSGGDDPERGAAIQARDVGLPSGDDYTKGMVLYERSGCYACHRTDSYQVLPKDTDPKKNPTLDPNRRFRRPGPPFTHIKDKVGQDWAVKWVRAPKDFRLSTRMPHFFGQSNARTLDVDGRKVPPQESEPLIVGSMIKYLFATSATREYKAVAPPSAPDPKRGLAMFEQVGCRACHTATPDSEYAKRKELRNPDDEWRAPTGESWTLKEFGPNLSGLASKFADDPERGKAWLYQWIKNPKHYFADSRMPAFPLTEQDLHDITAWLMTLKKEGDFDKKPGMPEFNDAQHKILDSLIFEQLRSKLPDVDAQVALDAMKARPADKILWYGRRMVQNYGCYSCHEMTPEKEGDPFLKERLPIAELPVDWKDQEGIGVELTGSQPEGNKAVDQLAFGYTHYDGLKHHGVHFEHPFFKKPYKHLDPENGEPEVVKVRDFRHVWIKNKLLDPRVFDGGKLASLPPDELLKMPNFYLNPEEVRLLTTFVLSFTNHDIPLNLVSQAKRRMNEDQVAINRGHRLIRDNNCRACHRFSLEKLEVEWVREEPTPTGPKVVRSYEWIEGLGELLDADTTEGILSRYGIKGTTPGKPPQLYTFNWVSDGCTMEMPKVVNRSSRFVLVDGKKTAYLDATTVNGEEKVVLREIRRRKPVDGGEILPHIAKYKKDHEETMVDGDGEPLYDLEDPSTLSARYPPMLRSQGVKTQAEWLFEFLKNPAGFPIRPALHPLTPGGKGAPDPNVRMPDFGFDDEEAAALVRYFWARDRRAEEETHPFTSFPERDSRTFASRKETLEKAYPYIQRICGECHFLNGAEPPGSVNNSYKFAPELNQVQDRLRTRWLYPWLREPSAVYPGTPMTSADYKPIGDGDQDKGLKTAVEFLMNMRRLQPPAAPAPESEKKPEPPQPPEKKEK
jgi:cytochrome c551/c552